MAGTITSANTILTLFVTEVFSAPQQIQEFAADDIYDMEAIEAAETSMGVDGVLSGGFINVAQRQKIMLQANSPSNDFFDQLYAAQKSAQDIFRIQGQTVLPAIRRQFDMNRGILKIWPPMPSAGKTLKPRGFTIEWETVTPSPL